MATITPANSGTSIVIPVPPIPPDPEPPDPGSSPMLPPPVNDIGHQNSLTDPSQSSIVTLDPFIPLQDSVRPKPKNKAANKFKGAVYERLPGLFEPASYDKFLTLNALNGKELKTLTYLMYIETLFHV